MDLSLNSLRVLRAVAEQRSFTAAARHLGYTQSAVSRQVAQLETQFGVRLFERAPRGVTLTVAGQTLLGHASTALDALDAARRELDGEEPAARPVRLGYFPAAGMTLVPHVLDEVRRRGPGLEVVTSEGSTPGLARALRAGSLDLALLTSRAPHRAPDSLAPPLVDEPLVDIELRLAVASSGPLGDRRTVDVSELSGHTWIASRGVRGEPALGVWPGVPGRAAVHHHAADWLTKLNLVARGAGITTVPGALLPGFAGVHLLRVDGVPAEVRRLTLAQAPGAPHASTELVIDAVRAAVDEALADGSD